MAFHTSAFSPAFGSGAVLTPAGTSAQVNISGFNCENLCLTNLGANVCYVRLGEAGATVTATTADFPIAGGAQVVITKSVDQKVLAHISATGTTLHIMSGNGL